MYMTVRSFALSFTARTVGSLLAVQRLPQQLVHFDHQKGQLGDPAGVAERDSAAVIYAEDQMPGAVTSEWLGKMLLLRLSP